MRSGFKRFFHENDNPRLDGLSEIDSDQAIHYLNITLYDGHSTEKSKYEKQSFQIAYSRRFHKLINIYICCVCVQTCLVE